MADNSIPTSISPKVVSDYVFGGIRRDIEARLTEPKLSGALKDLDEIITWFLDELIKAPVVDLTRVEELRSQCKARNIELYRKWLNDLL